MVTAPPRRLPAVSRRSLLIGAGGGGALMLAWAVWPRAYAPNLVAAKGETILSGYLKIGADGQVIAVCPQVELGQGAYSLIAQIIADELGADWRQVGIEPAPINPLYANALFAAEWQSGWFDDELGQITGGSSSVRAFEAPARAAAAAARVLLCKAAAARWDASWQACETGDGFVTRGEDRLRFGDLAAEASRYSVPDPVPLRADHPLAGRGLARLDVPAKLDGSANFAADIRLPGMVFASIRQGGLGDVRLGPIDRKRALSVTGVIDIVARERWVAVVASNWWAANRGLAALRPRFVTTGQRVDDRQIGAALEAALAEGGSILASAGDAAAMPGQGRIVSARYGVAPSLHLAVEPMAATASFAKDRLQLWIATQAPAAARAAAAAAIGIPEDAVDVHAMMAGGSFGRKYEIDIAAQVAVLAFDLKRPVQLMWSRSEDTLHDRPRPPARAEMRARVGAAGQLEAWAVKIAAPDAIGQLRARLASGAARPLATASQAHDLAVAGAVPPYAIANYSVAHHPADIGMAVGKWRSGAHSYTAFFTECFIDELSAACGVEPFSLRMAALSANPRLALCLSKVAAKGGWQGGGPGTGQGLACHSLLGGYIALLAEAQIGDGGRVRVTRLVCVADVGRVINPDIARQQIEGGLLFGMAAATGAAMSVKRGLILPLRFAAAGLPLLRDMPEISVELIRTAEPPAGIGEIAVPVVAPAIANALFTQTGRRFRTLPFTAASAER